LSEQATEQKPKEKKKRDIPGEVRIVSRERELYFNHPKSVIQAHRIEEVLPALRQAAVALDSGNHIAGYLAYEAAPAFDSALKTHDPGGHPLLWFGVYGRPKESLPRNPSANPFHVGDWEALISRDDYVAAIGRIREYIEAGDTYQVNFTFPMRASFEGDALNWFRVLCQAQRADHCAYIDTGGQQFLSVSPELFFELEGDTIVVRPMKGTRQRGLWPEADRKAAEELANSEKEQAENVMIVDLLRNDLGRICDAGTVEATSLFDVERYETIWQMTSTVVGKTSAGLPDILTALFPSGSVTGAPKVRTMEILRELEPYPRGVYCGAIGWMSPERKAEFNVAIRTVDIDPEKNEAQYHVGAGITWDSTAEAEYEECCSKASVLLHRPPDFSLMESIRYDDDGFYLLGEHLDRLAASADYFGFPFNPEQAKRELLDRVKPWPVSAMRPLKVRMLVGRAGGVQVEAVPAQPATAVTLGFSRDPVDVNDLYLYHKTTQRNIYETALCTRPDCDDVLLWNGRGEITECCNGNIVLQIDGERFTPPVDCGLLPGIYRAHLLRVGSIIERVLLKEDIDRAENIWLINSVRRWVPVIWNSYTHTVV